MKLIHGDCIEKMKDIPDGSIDMVMTSPPYDNLRDYGKDFIGWGEHIWKPVLEGIFRVLKEGGVCVWVVGDATIKGSETGTSFRQALYWMEIGGKLHDTMIYSKNALPKNHKRYEQEFEYMFILVKGKIKTFNPIKIPTLYPEKETARKNSFYSKTNEKNRSARSGKKRSPVGVDKIKGNIWRYSVGKGHSTNDKIAFQHPAIFPESLAHDHIISWSNKSDTILDPFMGSGTTGIACYDLGREFIGIELDEGYFKIAKDRIQEYQSQGRLF